MYALRNEKNTKRNKKNTVAGSCNTKSNQLCKERLGAGIAGFLVVVARALDFSVHLEARAALGGGGSLRGDTASGLCTNDVSY